MVFHAQDGPREAQREGVESSRVSASHGFHALDGPRRAAFFCHRLLLLVALMLLLASRALSQMPFVRVMRVMSDESDECDECDACNGFQKRM